MEQYIPKSALVAEIESLKRTTFTNFDEGVNATVQTLLEVVDTLEVKEVDLDDAVEEAKDTAKRDMAWDVHVMISEGKSIAEIDHYVCGICDF